MSGIAGTRVLSFAELAPRSLYRGRPLSAATSLAYGHNPAIRLNVKVLMSSPQEQYDDAMFEFSTGNYDEAIARFLAVLKEDPSHFDAQLALGMAYYRKGDYATAIAEGRKAQKLRPGDQLVHTNLSLFYMKAGDKGLAEHHGMQARVASWKEDKTPPGQKPASDPDLELAKPQSPPVKSPEKFPDMPWKKKP
jgi:tetratricopeptide (TPR) repeat protein